MKTLKFHSLYEVMFDYRGVTQLPSGTAPHNPAQARVVVLNTETTSVSDAEDAECQEAAARGQAALETWVLQHFRAADERAARSLELAMSPPHGVQH